MTESAKLLIIGSNLSSIRKWAYGSFLFFTENDVDEIISSLKSNKFTYIFIGNCGNQLLNYIINDSNIPLILIESKKAVQLNDWILSKSNVLVFNTPDNQTDFDLAMRNYEKYLSSLTNPIQEPANNTDDSYIADEITKSRESLEMVSRLVGIGEITAFIIHELKQPLTAILNYIELSVRRIEQTEKVLDYLKKANTQVIRMTEMISNLNRYTQKTSIGFVNVNRIIEEALELLRQRFVIHNIKIEIDLSHDIPLINGNYNQLLQVFLNIINNAFDALQSSNIKNKILFIRTFHSDDDDTIGIEITDNGLGIPKELHNNIFDMFFTTKDGGKGTGLGLYITKKIIESHCGNIKLLSSIGEGTTFLICFPEKQTISST